MERGLFYRVVLALNVSIVFFLSIESFMSGILLALCSYCLTFILQYFIDHGQVLGFICVLTSTCQVRYAPDGHLLLE